MPSSPSRQRGMSTLMILSLIAGLLLLITAGTVAALYYAGVFGGEDEEVAEGEEEDAPPPDPIFLPIEPALVTHLDDDDRSRYVQVGIQLMAREQEVIDLAQDHLPVIRNNLLMLMASQTMDDLDGRDGRQQLREAALEEVNAVLEEAGSEERLENLYFTEFVTQ